MTEAEPKQRRTPVQDVLLVATSLVVVLGALELGFRIFGYQGSHERAIVAFDDRYGDIPKDSWPFANDPASKELELFTGKVRLGKASGVRRLAFVGDSGIQGAGVQLGEAFPERFSARLPADAHIEVINLGIPGLTTVGELNLTRDRVLALDPDQIVLGVFMANDIQFNLQATKSFRRPPAVNWLRRNSALVHFTYLKLLAASAQHADGTVVNISAVDERGIPMFNYVAGEFATYVTPMSPTVKMAFDVTASALAEFRDLAQEHDMGFTVVLVPTLSSLVRKLEFPGDTGEEALWLGKLDAVSRVDVQQPTREILRICRELAITCVDPTPVLAQRLGRRAIIEGDDHPTAAAHDVIAELLLEQFDVGSARFRP